MQEYSTNEFRPRSFAPTCRFEAVFKHSNGDGTYELCRQRAEGIYTGLLITREFCINGDDQPELVQKYSQWTASPAVLMEGELCPACEFSNYIGMVLTSDSDADVIALSGLGERVTKVFSYPESESSRGDNHGS